MRRQVTFVAPHQIQRHPAGTTLKCVGIILLITLWKTSQAPGTSSLPHGQFTFEIQVLKHTTDLSPFSSFHIAPDRAPHPPKQLLLGGQMTQRSHKSSSASRIHVHTQTRSPLLYYVVLTGLAQSLRLKH